MKFCYFASTIVLAFSVTAVCANNFPVTLAPVFSEISVLLRMIPLKSALVPSVAAPETTQKIFFA